VVDGREKLLFVRRRVFEKMSEVCGRKRKSDSNSEKKMKKKKKEVVVVEEGECPPQVDLTQNETEQAVRDLLKELGDIQVDDHSTPVENIAAFSFDNNESCDQDADEKKKNEMSLEERFKKSVTSVEVFDTIEDYEKYLNGEKRES